MQYRDLSLVNIELGPIGVRSNGKLTTVSDVVAYALSVRNLYDSVSPSVVEVILSAKTKLVYIPHGKLVSYTITKCPETNKSNVNNAIRCKSGKTIRLNSVYKDDIIFINSTGYEVFLKFKMVENGRV